MKVYVVNKYIDDKFAYIEAVYGKEEGLYEFLNMNVYKPADFDPLEDIQWWEFRSKFDKSAHYKVEVNELR